MRQIIAAAQKLNISVRVKDGECLVSLPCSEWIRIRKIDGYSQFHLTASKAVEKLLTQSYDLQSTKAGYYLIDEETVCSFIATVSGGIVNRAVSRCKDDLAVMALQLKSMESTQQRTEGVKRIGQNTLRQLLLVSIGECEVSGIRNKDLLVVSHIKSWADCVDGGEERLDTENVLLLAANWDALFDKKFISFDPETGKMIKSERISEEDLIKFGVPKDWRETVRIPVNTERRKNYLSWHLNAMRDKDVSWMNKSSL
jgi:hypothetical protein